MSELPPLRDRRRNGVFDWQLINELALENPGQWVEVTPLVAKSRRSAFRRTCIKRCLDVEFRRALEHPYDEPYAYTAYVRAKEDE